MSLWNIALRSILQRGVASTLTMLSMALGVMMVVLVLSIHGVVAQSFKNNADLGYSIIVGATKGGKLQLTLNAVYFISNTLDPIPYDYYLEFLTEEERKEHYQQSIAAHEFENRWQTAQAESLALATGGGGSLVSLLAIEATHEHEKKDLPWERRGKFAAYTGLAVPIMMGDFLGQFRVVATSPIYFDELEYDTENHLKYEFAQGRNFKTWSPEHGYFEAVLGANVAREMNLKIGDDFSPSHGEPGAGGHEQRFTVVGILKRSGKPIDRGAFINMEGFYLMEDHSKPLEEEPVDEDDEPVERVGGEGYTPVAEPDRRSALPVEQREVTAVLVRTSNMMAGAFLPGIIDDGKVAQAALPIEQITLLLDQTVAPFRWLLVLLTAMICFVSGVSILVSIYNSMNDRKRDIAVMRALGAGREAVMTIIMLESIMIASVGGFLGWIAAHAINAFASGLIADRTGVTIGFFHLTPGWNLLEILQGVNNNEGNPELLLSIFGQSLLAIAVGLIIAGMVMIAMSNRGSSRSMVSTALSVLLPPSVLLTPTKPSPLVGWGLLLWVIGFATLVVVGPVMLMNWEVSSELLLVPALLLLASLVGFLPAMNAYNTDVAEAL